MKKFAYLFIAMLLVGCSNDEPTKDWSNPDSYVSKNKIVAGDIDYSILSRYSASLKDATYTCASFEFYDRDDENDGEFIKPEGMIGLECTMPRQLIIKEGRCWEAMKLFSPVTGPRCFCTALALVNAAENKDYNVFIKHDLVVDQSAGNLSIGSANYGILHADDNNLVLSEKYRSYKDSTHKTSEGFLICVYTLSEPFKVKGTPATFDSTKEAYDWLIELFRKNFGESVNRNDLYDGEVILDYPMFYLSDLIDERDRYSN